MYGLYIIICIFLVYMLQFSFIFFLPDMPVVKSLGYSATDVSDSLEIKMGGLGEIIDPTKHCPKCYVRTTNGRCTFSRSAC